jgi:hypothetical protein
MTKINNLFFIFLLSCIGFGIGNVYWNKDYTQIIFMGVSSLIGMLIIFSKYFYSKEAHDFFRKQVFFTSLISLLCVIVHSNRNIFKVIDLTFDNALIGALLLWIFTMKYRSNEDNKKKDNEVNTGQGPTLA